MYLTSTEIPIPGNALPVHASVLNQRQNAATLTSPPALVWARGGASLPRTLFLHRPRSRDATNAESSARLIKYCYLIPDSAAPIAICYAVFPQALFPPNMPSSGYLLFSLFGFVILEAMTSPHPLLPILLMDHIEFFFSIDFPVDVSGPSHVSVCRACSRIPRPLCFPTPSHQSPSEAVCLL
jgi:hypothetical protein